MKIIACHRYTSALFRFAPTSITGIISRCMNTARFRSRNTGSKKYIAVDFESLEEYKKIHGDLIVPQKFTFDQNASTKLGFAAHCLGAHVKLLRKRAKLASKKNIVATKGISPEDRKKLDELGFAWNGYDGKFMRILKGLTTYNNLHNNFIVPTSFVIPDGDPLWSRELWGLKLGKLLHNLRQHKKLSKTRRGALETLGIPLDGNSDLEGEKIKKALQVYKKLHGGNLNVPRTFIIPEGDVKWPKALWGMKLGRRVQGIVYKGYYSPLHDQFKKLGLASGGKPTRLGDIQFYVYRSATKQQLV